MAQKTRTRETRERSRARIVDATVELMRERSYAELNVGEIMERAGIGRTLFYRHFDDLGDLLLRIGRDAVGDLYDAQVSLAATRVGPDYASVRAAMEPAVDAYSRHGPLLRALSEAAAADPLVAAQETEIRERFDRLIEDTIRRGIEDDAVTCPPPYPAESARALNRLNESYLLDVFGREPKVSTETAVETLSDIWIAFVQRRRSKG